MITIIPFYFGLQQIQDSVVESATKVSPFNAAAYGVLVGVLILFIYMMWKDKERQAETYEKMADAMKGIEISMRSMDEMKTMLYVDKFNRAVPPPSTHNRADSSTRRSTDY